MTPGEALAWIQEWMGEATNFPARVGRSGRFNHPIQADLVYYCYTWNARTRKWTGKAACANRRQGLSTLRRPV
ncbi:hypothetical protein D7W79_29615 [Corallococcus exercitus]|nr:hypothetical protein D7W79_29615 [Corallococcus exercitus]